MDERTYSVAMKANSKISAIFKSEDCCINSIGKNQSLSFMQETIINNHNASPSVNINEPMREL